MATKTKGNPKGKAARKPARRPRQTHLPGTERTVIAEVETAAESFVEIRDDRMEQTKREVKAKAVLLNAMKSHGLTVYKIETAHGDMLVKVDSKSDVKVRKVKEERRKRAATNGHAEPEVDGE